jgi:putative ABC transport system permease protein
MAWVRRLANTFRTGRLRRDIDREQAFHIAERADDLRAAGLDEREALRRARIQFGSPTATVEDTRDVDVFAAADAAWRNVRYALRALRRTPGFTVTVVLTLAFGIGANSAVFSVVDAVLLRPLPFPNPDELVTLRQTDPTVGESLVAGARILDWRQATGTLAAVSGYLIEDVSDSTGELPQRVQRAKVLPGFFDVWGVHPALGRTFAGPEHQLDGPDAVVISHRYWTTRFGGDGDVLSKTVRMAERSYQIVGVMPAGFAFLERETDWWVPERLNAPWAQVRQFRSTIGIARLRRDATIDQARAELAGVQAELARRFPQTDRDLRPVVIPLKETLVAKSRRSLWVLFGAVSILLLIACSNVAALVLSRGAQRAPEIALRYSLGATRRAITWQLLTESAVLALAGGAAGLAVAWAAARGLAWLAPDVPRLNEAGLDGRIVLYTSLSVIVVALLSGLAPALRSSRGGGAPRALARISRRHRLQWVLAGVQMSLAVALLAGAGLLVQSAMLLGRVDAGFDPAGVLTFQISASFGEERNSDRTPQRINTTLDALRALPGVTAAATAINLPVVHQFPNNVTIVDTGRDVSADFRTVSPSYFETLRMPVVAGELCRQPRDPQGSWAVMVNRAFATRFLPGREAVGSHLRIGPAPSRIVGIVGNAREQGLEVEPQPTVYSCFSAPTPFPFFLVRTDRDPVSLTAAIRARSHELEPLRSVYNIVPLRDRIAGSRVDERLRTTVLTTFAVSALLLACLGVYGTLSYITRLQRREVGLRLALGAARGGIVRHFVGLGLRVAAIASAAGVALSFGLTRALAGTLYGVTPSDPVTLSMAVGIVLVVAALAALIPAARAALSHPMHILREE